MRTDPESPIVWHEPDGTPIGCQEKLKVLIEILNELRLVAQDAVDDALLMGCDEAQVRLVLRALVDSLETPFSVRKPASGSDRD